MASLLVDAKSLPETAMTFQNIKSLFQEHKYDFENTICNKKLVFCSDRNVLTVLVDSCYKYVHGRRGCSSAVVSKEVTREDMGNFGRYRDLYVYAVQKCSDLFVYDVTL